jgi:hypothetical protein
VTPAGPASVYTVTANTGSGSGTLGLNLVDNDSIVDAASNPLGGAGAVNGDFTGQVYTIDMAAPAAPVIISPADASTTTNTTPTLTGTAEANSTVEVRDRATATLVGSAVATGGNWSVTTIALSAGLHTLDVTARDAAGNTSTLAVLTITISLVSGPTFDVIPGSQTAPQTAQADEPLEQQIPITGLSPTTATVSATSSNMALIPNPTITGTGATRTLTFTPVANQVAVGQTDFADITVTATDGTSFPRTFRITVVGDTHSTLKWVNLDARMLAPGQETFDLEKSGAVVASGVTSAVRGLALETGTYTLNAPAGSAAVVKSLTFTVNGRCDITLP